MAKTAKIKVVQPVERWAFSKPLMEMHRHRKQVFVDRLHWQLASPGSWLEIDEFDNDYAVYIMAVCAEDGHHLGSVRLLPTTQPPMLGSVFGDLCPSGAPVGEDVWEISRLVAAPAAKGASLLRIYRQLAEGLVDFARQNGIARYTLVTEAHRVGALLAVGWTVNPLSLPTEFDGQLIEAVEIVIDEDSLRRVRERGRWSCVSVPAAPQAMSLA